jgi:hypothetical protein
METLTTTQIRDAFIEAIRGIVPSHEPLRSVRWSYTPAGRSRGRADLLGQATRSFDLIFGAGTPTFGWFGGAGTAYACRVAVAVSYAGIEPETLEHMLTADHVDLRDKLDALRDPALPGLCDVEVRGLENSAADDDGNVYVEHVFNVHYHQLTIA